MEPADHGNKLTRRTALKALGVGVVGGISLSSSTTSAAAQPVGDLIFEDDFEDGVFDWTDADHPEFWTETGGQVHYSPSSSAGETGDNWAVANETFDGDTGSLEWPVGIEVKAYATDTSASLGAFAAEGGPRKNLGSVRLGVTGSPYEGGGDTFSVINSQGQSFDVGTAPETGTWYTYRLVPNLQEDQIDVYRNGEHYTVPEPRDEPLDNTSIVLDGGTCWGCGGNGDRKYEYIKVWDIPTRIEVTIDIKPCSDPNAIEPGAEGVIPVGIKHTDEFNPVEQVNVDSLRFGAPDVVESGDGANPARSGKVEDVVPCDGDGRDDLVVHFPTQDTGFDGDEDTGRLEGETTDGTPLFGTDSVKIVGR